MVIDLLLGDQQDGHIPMKSVRDSAFSGRWLPESLLDGPEKTSIFTVPK